MTLFPRWISSFGKHPFVQGSVVLFSGAMMANILAYLYHVVVGRILGPSAYGELAALTSIFYILNAPSLVVQNVLVKFVSALKAKKAFGSAKRLFKRMNLYLGAIVGFCLLLGLPISGWIAEFLNITEVVNLFWLYLMFAAFLFSIVSLSFLQAYQQFSALTVLNIFGGILRLALGAAGATIGVSSALVANVVAAFFGYIASFIPLKKYLHYEETGVGVPLSDALLYSIPACVAVLCMTALYSVDVLLVKHFFSAESAGIYSSLSVLGKIIFFASSSLGAVAFPMVTERNELQKPYESIVRMALTAAAVMSLSITVVYFMFPVFVVHLLFGSAFASASQYLGQFGLFLTFFTLANLLMTIYLALGHTKVWILTAIASVAQVLVMSYSHATLHAVITNNTIICAALFSALLVYYPYAIKRY